MVLSWDGGVAASSTLGELPGFTLDATIECGKPLFRHGSSHYFELDRPATLEAHATTPDGTPYTSSVIWLESPSSGAELVCGSPTLSSSHLAPGTQLLRVAAYNAGPFLLHLSLTEWRDGG